MEQVSLFAGNQVHGIAGNHQFLIGGDDKNAYFGTGLTDLDFLAAAIVSFCIELNAQIRQVGADAGTGVDSVLADTCGKDNTVNAVHLGSISADVTQNGLGKHIQGHGSALVACFGCFFNITHIRADAGNTKQSGFLIEDSVHFCRGQVFLFHDIRNDGRVKIAGAGTHQYAFQRSETQGGIINFAAFYFGNGRTIAQMASDYFGILAQDLSGTHGYETMGSTVKTIAANLIFFIIFIGKAI